MDMRICEAENQRGVINIKSCHRLGFVGDIDFDMKTGCIMPLLYLDQEASAASCVGKRNM